MSTERSTAIRPDGPVRRALDIGVACCGLVLLCPGLVLLGWWIRVASPGPALYRQTRVGRDGRLFEIWKFRTMVVDADPCGPLVAGRADPRVTRPGRWLRSRRLDELPQLVNLLRGELTLIGPRPEVPQFVPHYTGRERDLLTVRPGVLGPGALLFAETQSGALDRTADPEGYYVAHQLHPKLALDLAYLEGRSLRDDLGLIRRTLGVLVGHEGDGS